MKSYDDSLIEQAENGVKCGECGATMKLRNGRYGRFWGCTRFPECRGAHGAHPDGRPLGIPANQATKNARMRAHDAFDSFWRGRRMKRSEAYRWLQQAMSMPADDAHIGRFTIEQCDMLIAAVSAAKEPTNV